MNCPDCRSRLEGIDSKGIQIHECSNCKGRWFDRGQLRAAKDSEDHHLRWLDFDPFGKDAEKLSVQSEGKVCPKCNKRMNSLKYTNSRVIIDKCNNCKGVWLDHGEFEKIINYLEKLLASETAKDYSKETFKQFIEIFTGSDGVVSEAKDFVAVLNLLETRISVENPRLANLCLGIYKVIPFK